MVKRSGVKPFMRAILKLEEEGFQPPLVNDVSSRITILYLYNLSVDIPTEPSKQAKQVLEDLIKDVFQ